MRTGFICVLLGALVYSGAAQEVAGEETFLKRGHELVRARNFAGARAEYARALKSTNAAVRSIAHLAMAQSYAREGKTEKAVGLYLQMPADAPAHHRMEAAELIRSLQGEAGDSSRVRIAPAAKAGVSLHVAAGGADGNDGSEQAPFATLERARDEIRKRRDVAWPPGGVEVVVHGGEYLVAETLKLEGRDSGRERAPVRYRAARGEKPVFRGGIRLEGFEAVADGPLWSRLPAETRGKVVQLDLKGAGAGNLLPLKLGGFASGHGFRTHPAHELFFNGQALQLARRPNEGFLRIEDVVVKDGTKGYDREGSKVGKFYYEGEIPAGWKNEPDLLLYGYWFWDWADSYERVAGIETKERVITLAEPFHRYGYSIGAPFYAINALSELDQPGEWYLDRESKVILMYPPGELKGARVELSLFPGRMLELDGVKHVRFEGLSWELGSGDAIRVSGGEEVLFAGCTVRRFAGNGIEINGGNGHGILSCDIYSLGRGGTVISGGNRKDLTPGRHFIENCEIHELSRIDHTYTPAVILSGVGNRVAHNRFHNVLSSAMRVGGNDHVIEFNEVFEVVRESDDQGGADMYGNATYRGNVFRFNYFHHIGNWEGKGENPKCGQAGIRLDDAISGTLVYANIFERCSAGKIGFGGVQIHGGKNNIIDNNLFIACAAAVSFTPWNEERWRTFTRDALRSGEVQAELYLKRYPELAQLATSANENQVWRNRTSLVEEFFRRGHARINSIDNAALDCCDPADEIPGFRRIPHEEIGLYPDEYRKELPSEVGEKK